MILYFSGTGNSAHAARRIAKSLGDDCLNLFERLRDKDYSALESVRPWVIVTPTYCWRIPRILADWFSHAELRGSRDVYFVLTCGDSIGNAGKYTRKLCEAKGMRYRGCAKIVMPENYIAMFNAPGETEARQIVAKAHPRIDEAAAHIAAGRDLPAGKAGLLGRIISGPVNPLFYRFSVKDKKFRTLGSCVVCGICAKLCPMQNITLEDGKPKWNGNCTHCMACICRCPHDAIEYGKASVGKPRYVCPE